MQLLHNASDSGNSQPEPHAGQVAQFIEALREVLEKVASPPPDEALQLMGRLESAQSKHRPPLISNPVHFHRISSILHGKPGPTMGELSDALSVPLYTATRMVDPLVENGLADRLSDPDDRRVVRVTLTDDGLRLHKAMEAHLAQTIQRIMACLTHQE